MTTEQLIQTIRTLKISQLRKQLEHDEKEAQDNGSDYYQDRLRHVKQFFLDAKEQW